MEERKERRGMAATGGKEKKKKTQEADASPISFST